MKEQERRYNAYYISAVTKELTPVAKIVRAEGVEILTEYNLKDFEGIDLENPPEYVKVHPLIIFNTYDPESYPTAEDASKLLENYPTAEYAFMHFGIFVEKPAEPNKIYGGLTSFRAEKRDDKFAGLIVDDEKALLPLTGKKAQYTASILEILKDFKKQSPELIKAMSGIMTKAQKEYTYKFSESLSDLYDEFFTYLLKTEGEIDIKPEFEIKTPPIRQRQPAKPENLVMPKSEIFKTAINMKESDFDEQGRAYKELKYPVLKDPVKTDLMLTKPIEDKLDNILLFPIDPEVFQVAVMREPVNKYDGKVFRAICTLIDYYISSDPEIVEKGGTIKLPITLTDMHRAMGYKSRLSNYEAQRIRNSVFKLSTTQIYYNWSEERKARHIIFTDELKDVWGNSLMCTRDVLYMLEAEHSSNIVPIHSRKGEDGAPIGVEGFIIKAIPPIYAHAKITRTIASVPLEWFEIKPLGRMTDRRNSLLQGLTERISTAHYFKEQGKDPNKGNYNVIVLDPFFYDSGIVVNNKQTRSDLIKDLEIILDDYKKKGLIKKYTYSQKASGIYSIKFYV